MFHFKETKVHCADGITSLGTGLDGQKISYHHRPRC